jgi:hypothetical protein
VPVLRISERTTFIGTRGCSEWRDNVSLITTNNTALADRANFGSVRLQPGECTRAARLQAQIQTGGPDRARTRQANQVIAREPRTHRPQVADCARKLMGQNPAQPRSKVARSQALRERSLGLTIRTTPFPETRVAMSGTFNSQSRSLHRLKSAGKLLGGPEFMSKRRAK